MSRPRPACQLWVSGRPHRRLTSAHDGPPAASSALSTSFQASAGTQSVEPPGIAAAATVRTWATACSWPEMPISSQSRTSDRGSTTSISKFRCRARLYPVSRSRSFARMPNRTRAWNTSRPSGSLVAVYRMRGTPQWLTHARAANPNSRLRKRASWGRRRVNTGAGSRWPGTTPAAVSWANRSSLASGNSAVPKTGRFVGTPISSPASISLNRRHPWAVRSGWEPVSVTVRPDHVRTVNTGLTPSSRQVETRTSRWRPSVSRARTVSTPRAAVRSNSSRAVTSSPVAVSTIGVSHATHLPIAGRDPTMFSVDGCSPESSSSTSW